MSIETIQAFFQDETLRTQRISFGAQGSTEEEKIAARSATLWFNLQLRESSIAASCTFSSEQKPLLTCLKKKDRAVCSVLVWFVFCVALSAFWAYCGILKWRKEYAKACIEVATGK